LSEESSVLELRFRILGSFEMRATERRRVAPLEGRKAQELISFLLLVPGQAKARDVAVEALWPGAAPETGRKQIRQALWHIHQAADRDTADSERLVIADSDHLAVNPNRILSCDAVEFTEAMERLESRIAGVDDIQRVERALDLYRGPLLDGCYAEWCLVERERLEGLYLSALDGASVQAEARLDYESAAHWASALLRIDPAHERSHRRLMRLYFAMDDRTRALRQFERCCHALESELGVRPSSRTLAVAAAIRADVEPPAPRERVTVLPPRSERQAVLRELAALRRAVDELRRSVLERLA
jgi:DNA-binding SARP family transcriptional activator